MLERGIVKMASQEREFSRLLSWEVFNFMSVEHAICEFDNSNIVNIKGYNDSGKSAMLRALDVLFTNMKPTKQIDFIQDGKEYFRIVANFSDGISILRDKYINGQSLYEMWKDNQCLFSTKKGNALTKVTDVPQPIKDYLGIVSYEDIVLNSRSCFEKQLGVQTTGSENYKLFNTVLKSEEIASASAMLNNDKNKLLADINAEDQELNANKTIITIGANLTEHLIEYLKSQDLIIDNYDLMVQVLSNMLALSCQVDNLVITPKIDKLDISQFQSLCNIKGIYDEINGLRIIPHIPNIDIKQFETLCNISNLYNTLDSIPDTVELSHIDFTQLTSISNIFMLFNSILDCDKVLDDIDSSLLSINEELDSYIKESERIGVKMVKCPVCSQIFDAGTNHLD